MFKWIGKLFKRKRHGVEITIYPLQGLGGDRKATLKFVKKWFKKCGNFTATYEDIKTTRTQGHMKIYAKIPASKAAKLSRLANKLDIDIELFYGKPESMDKKSSNKVNYHEQKDSDWVVAA